MMFSLELYCALWRLWEGLYFSLLKLAIPSLFEHGPVFQLHTHLPPGEGAPVWGTDLGSRPSGLWYQVPSFLGHQILFVLS